MVVFVCGSCGESVKKAAVDKHCQTQCRNCTTLSCIDCGKTFPGESFRTHNACITEEEKWHGKDYKAKESSNSGKKKQDAWTESIQNAIVSARSNDPKLKMTLERLLTYDNVPRKETKFKNFVQNSMRVHDQRLISSIWDIVKSKDTLAKPAFQPTGSSPAVPTDTPSQVPPAAVNGSKKAPNASGEEEARIDPPNKKLKANGHSDHMNTSAASLKPSLNKGSLSGETSVKFKWKKGIKNVLSEADGFTMSGKKLRKKVLKSFASSSGATEQTDDFREYANRKFDKFLKKYPDLFLLKEDMVTLVS